MCIFYFIAISIKTCLQNSFPWWQTYIHNSFNTDFYCYASSCSGKHNRSTQIFRLYIKLYCRLRCCLLSEFFNSTAFADIFCGTCRKIYIPTHILSQKYILFGCLWRFSVVYWHQMFFSITERYGGINMSHLPLILSVIMTVIGILLCIIVLLQSGRSAGLGAISGSASNADSYWSKNKGSSMEGALERYTKIFGALFIILGIVINFIV